MTLLAQIQRALVPRYRVETELGRGGMALVFRAHDVANSRDVAVKVLRPELGAALGAERFEREIQIASSIVHPNILPVYDAGEADGLLYYVMPLVEDESLADRLERETQLPIPEAVRIVQQVARALHHAHTRGIVHRDIKPGNILLIGNEAMVADFGIAHVTGSISGEKLTSTGLALGTPQYMCPEQAAGGSVDGRADTYSLGCVLYELLAGSPPFTGKTLQIILARHAVDPIPPVRTVRGTVPQGIADALETALAKTPADRFPTAQAFADALEVGLVEGQTSSHASRQRRARWRRALPVAAGATVLIAAVAAWFSTQPGRAPVPLDANAIAVAPFRTAGALDPALGDLRTGVPELLYLRLTGEVGARALYPGTAAAAFGDETNQSQKAAIDAARALGSAQLLLGQVFGAAGDIAISATLIDVVTGNEIARVDDLRGPADSLLGLVDRLAIELLGRRAGEPRHRLSDLMATDPAAVREYLAGQTAFGAGSHQRAVEHFANAVETDSTFALAALGLAVSDYFAGSGVYYQRGLRLAHAARDRLTERDRIFLEAFGGPRYPYAASIASEITAWESAARAMPDRKDVQFQFGDILFHFGASAGIARPRELAAASFRGTLRLDPAHGPAIGHLFQLEALAGNMEEARRLGTLYLADSTRDERPYYQWTMDLSLGTAEEIAGWDQKMNGIDDRSLYRIFLRAQMDGRPIVHAERAAEALVATAGSPDNLVSAYQNQEYLSLNRGRPNQALAFRRQVRELSPNDGSVLTEVIGALYWQGDSADVVRTLAERGGAGQLSRFDQLCAVTLWQVGRGQYDGYQSAVTEMRASVPDSGGPFLSSMALCAGIVEAQATAGLDLPGALQALEYLDSQMGQGPYGHRHLLAVANLTVARLFERRGDNQRALAAIGRRAYDSAYALVCLSTFFREEGRLAAAAGDFERAIEAYNLFLNLRSDPEPELLAETVQVREELGRISGETTASPN